MQLAWKLLTLETICKNRLYVYARVLLQKLLWKGAKTLHTLPACLGVGLSAFSKPVG